MNLKDGIKRLLGVEKTPQASQEVPRRQRTPQDSATREQLRRDAAEHEGVLSRQFAKTLDAADKGLMFPESAKDPLEYLGNVEPLGLTEQEKEIVRQWTLELLEERGEKSVWNSRLRLKLELRYLMVEGGLQSLPGHKDAGKR